jgi:phage gpG-like protein
VAGLAIRFEQSGAAAVEHELLAFERRLAEPRPALAAVAERMRLLERERFDRQGPGWAPLAESTLASKSAAGLDPRILHATLALRKSLTEHGGDNVEVITDQGLTFGSSVAYGAFHRSGTSVMPARDPMDFSVTNLRSFTLEIQRYAVHGETGLVPGLS